MRLVILILVALIVVSCGSSRGADQPLEQRIIGKWSGIQVNSNGDPIPATWEFLEGGTMIVTITGLGQSFGAEWSTEGSRINFTTELAPDEPNYRDVEFVSDDVMKLSKEDIEETFTRVEE